MNAAIEPFGALADGRAIERVTLAGENGFSVGILTYGATIQSILAPGRNGVIADVVLGHDALEGYVASRDFLGATIGRYANRIAGGRFSLGGRSVQVPPNDGPNALHGGAEGFDRKVFAIEEATETRLAMTLQSPDGEGGFPGNLEVRVVYTVEGTSLSIALEARSDAETVVNLTNHSYFNLAGSGSALAHALQVEADAIVPVDREGIPTGGTMAIDGTPFDFRQARPISERLREAHPQIMAVRGYDHNFCLRGGRTRTARPAAVLGDPESGRTLTISTTEPGLQVYSGNFLDGSLAGRGGLAYRQADGICLEPQTFPDAPNHTEFPSARLAPGETYRHDIVMSFARESRP